MSRRVIRCDGTEEPLSGPVSSIVACKLIGAETFDVVPLRHLGQPLQVMLVDDHGYETRTIERDAGHFELRPVRARKPVNAKATALYHANCQPGTTHQIVGDVVVTLDSDFQ